MRVISPAKLNLSLSVGSVRDDGFHQVDSFFHLLSLHDVLHLHPAFSFDFTSSLNLGIPDEDNLVVKAVKAMAELHNRELPALHLKLEKHIPHGAGLGGGSSNAAAAIFALSKLWDAQADDLKHLALAAELGSDVPLFLAPTTASVMTGRGEILVQSRSPLQLEHILVIKPKDASSPTGAVYRAFDANPQPTHSIDEWKNNLEPAAIAISPQTGEALDWLIKQRGVKVAQVAGSGSACWAYFATADDLECAAAAAQQRDYWFAKTSTVDVGICLQ